MIDDPCVPEAAAKGGEFALSATYRVARDAPFPAGVWRGSVTAAVGEIAVKPPRKRTRRLPWDEPVDDKALGLDEIRLPDRQGR